MFFPLLNRQLIHHDRNPNYLATHGEVKNLSIQNAKFCWRVFQTINNHDIKVYSVLCKSSELSLQSLLSMFLKWQTYITAHKLRSKTILNCACSNLIMKRNHIKNVCNKKNFISLHFKLRNTRASVCFVCSCRTAKLTLFEHLSVAANYDK